MLSPVGGTDTMPYGMYRLLGPDFMVISVSLALASFKSEDIDRAVAAIEPQVGHLVSRGADLILQSGTPLALSLGPRVSNGCWRGTRGRAASRSSPRRSTRSSGARRRCPPGS